MRSDGSGGNLLSVPAGGSKLPMSHMAIDRKQHLIQMNGREVFRFATRVMASATRETADLAGWKVEDIDYVIPHQANQRIIEAAARGLRLPMDKFIVNLEHYGNTSTASIPLAMVEALDKGLIPDGSNLVLVGFGAGLTWGALSMHWVEPKVEVSEIERRRRGLLTFLARIQSFLRRIRRRIEGIIWRTSSQGRKEE
jgi:3-oxoacyl-[acyl-carrier-protein] synthase-3